jgi:hypothetical protein
VFQSNAISSIVAKLPLESGYLGRMFCKRTGRPSALSILWGRT